MPKQTILFEPRQCTGCLACELACTSRKHGAFGREGSAIRVAFDALAGLADATFTAACDLCGPLVTPLCIEFCATRALALGRR
jgi:Fe-S-cluster-containing dehydrogenase component